LLAGVTAGVMNALAGSGSLVTLPALVWLGLPSTIANGTNRVGIVVQCLIGVETFRRGGRLDFEGTPWLIGPTALGALVGAWLATRLDAAQTDTAIGLVMVGMLGVLLFDPQKWLREETESFEGRPPAWLLGFLFVVGIYGGFIQAGVGILMLATLVMGAGYEVVEANAVKLLIALVFTTGALSVFLYNGRVNWAYGALLAVGQGTGAWLGATFAVESDEAARWIRRLLIVIVVVASLDFFGGLDWIVG
jgi:uncharacterized membrane protein YfcA